MFPSGAHFFFVFSVPTSFLCFRVLHLSFSFFFLFPFLLNQKPVGAYCRHTCSPVDASFSLWTVWSFLWGLCKGLSFTLVATDLLPSCYLSWSCSVQCMLGSVCVSKLKFQQHQTALELAWGLLCFSFVRISCMLQSHRWLTLSHK